MARSEFNIGPLINVMEALRQQLERQLDYQMQQQEKVKAEPRILRDEDERVQRILAGANAVQATQTEWGRASRRGQRQEAAGQLNLAQPDNLPPDTGRAQPQDPPEPTPNLNMPPPRRDTGFAQGLHQARPSSFTQSRDPRPFEEDLEQARSELPPLSTIQRFRREYRQTEGGRATRLRQALGSMASPLKPDNLPPDSQGPDDGGDTGKTATPPPQPGGSGPGHGFNPQDPLGFGNTNATTALTWAALGEHGGPHWMRNLYLGSWQFQQGLGWAGRNTNNLRQALNNPNSNTSNVIGKIPGLSNVVNNQNLGALSGALNIAADHPMATYLAYSGLKRGTQFVGNRFAQLRDYQATGQQFGYGGPSIGGQSAFGFHNPMGDFGTAAQVGAAMSVEQQALMGRIPGQGFGTGLSAQQAQGDVQSLAGQGFSMAPIGGGGVGGAALSAISSIPGIGGPLAGELGGLAHQIAGIPVIGGALSGLLTGHGRTPQGDIANIAQNLDRPLQTRFPGLSGEDINQFTPALRHSGTSIQQMTDSLNSLGIAAHSAKETVGQFAGSLSESAQSFQSMGSSLQGGVDIGMGFNAATGMDPRVASQAAQNPLFQGMAMSHYGILPSGLGDMSSGAFTSNTLQTLQMLQRGLSGINHPTTQTINGVRLPVAQGQQQMYDQIASMTGMNANDVKYMLQDQNQIQARATATQAIGDPNSNSGIFGLVNQGQRLHHGKLTDQEYSQVNQDWQKAVVPYLKQSGVSAKEIRHLNSISGMRDRLTAAEGDIHDRSNNDPLNQIQNKPNANTVQVEFTGQAAKFFQQVGGGSSPSPAKQSANAAWSGGNWNPGGGGPFGGYNKIANSTTGDLSGGASSSAWDYLNRSG